MASSNRSYQIPPWMRPLAQRLSPTIRTLVLAMAVPWLFYVLVKPVRGLLEEYLILGPNIMKGYVWQVATAIFVDPSPLAFLNLLGLWFVGAAIERTLGRRRFLVVFFVPGLMSHVVFVLFSSWWGMWMLNGGCGDSVLGLFVGLAVLYGPAQVRVIGSLAMSARSLAALFVFLVLISAGAYGAWPALFGTLSAVATAYLLCGGRGQSAREILSWAQRRLSRRHMRVMDGGRSSHRRDFLN